jgi:hypothetical protein
MLYYFRDHGDADNDTYRLRQTAEEVIMRWDDTFVECCSGYRINERVVAFTFLGRRREVAEIIDRWYEGGIEAGRQEVDYFKVRTTEGDIFLLRYLPFSDTWSIRAYKDPASIIGVC